ncbi:XdhC/CoxI family protein [Streptomyces sp. NPDC006798]|uniref:XdhC family protein n=1 Tax=Streptomyces sp. NPDC006798 TaxID=3155462 RepID=UPI00340D066D
MLDIADELHRWLRDGRTFAVATVVAVSGSAPRLPGAALAVDTEGRAVGSVSGGCVEGAVYELCVRVLSEGRPLRERFGTFDPDDAFATGLTCGGELDVLVVPVAPDGPEAAAVTRAAEGDTTALVRITGGPAGLLGRALAVAPDGAYHGTLGGPPGRDRAAAAEARALLETGRSGTVTVGADGTGADGDRCEDPLTLFVEAGAPPPRMIVFGAVDFAAALVRIGTFLGYRVTVCDARPVFATAERFPGADEVVVEWPHRYLRATGTDRRTVLCVLTHDAKFDVPLLEYALRLPVAYIGAMGSRRTHADRERRLRAAGVTARELARLRSPIGLDLGARTPEETALSIAAEIVANRRGGGGLPLTDTGTPIHHDEPRPVPRPEPRPGPGPVAA